MSAARDNKASPVAGGYESDISHSNGKAGASRPEGPAMSDPPLPYDEDAPPLPDEPPPDDGDDGWDYAWHEVAQTFYYYNKRTGATSWENPRVPEATTAALATAYSHAPYDRFANFYHFFCLIPA
jgi:hypothetical protein